MTDVICLSLSTATSNCRDNAVMLNGSCYYVSDSAKSSWFTARMDCLARGGDLLRITSHAVWSTVKAHLLSAKNRYRYWIGLSAVYWYWHWHGHNGKSAGQ